MKKYILSYYDEYEDDNFVKTYDTIEDALDCAKSQVSSNEEEPCANGLLERGYYIISYGPERLELEVKEVEE